MSTEPENNDLQRITDEIAWYNAQLPKMRGIYETILQAWQSYYSEQMHFLVHHHGPVSERKIIETLIERGIYQDDFCFIHYDHTWRSDDVEKACLELLKILPETEFFELELSWNSDQYGNITDIKYSIKLLVHPNNIALSETNQ
ncbi:MAG: hypothetical protein PHN19_01060 [Patescibacteria group bacterium]|nr:hypothetical protein [Patescibacteria group bacterium]